jgi:hypothetical protein
MDKSEVVIKPYGALPCHLETFEIRGQDACEDDFGSGGDESPETAEEYACGYWRFRADLKKAPEAMKKYGLSIEEFIEVCDMLEDALNVGECGWCV